MSAFIGHKFSEVRASLWIVIRPSLLLNEVMRWMRQVGPGGSLASECSYIDELWVPTSDKVTAWQCKAQNIFCYTGIQLRCAPAELA